MKIFIAAVAMGLSIAPVYAQTSGLSHIQGVESDEFSNVMKINGVVESENPFGGIFKLWKLRSFVSKRDGSTTHQLYLSVAYPNEPGRKVFDWASDDTATPLNVTHIYGHDSSEDCAIEVTTAVLRAHASTGYRIKISGESGNSFILTISPNQIAAQLDTMEKCLEYIHAQGNVVDDQRGPHLLKHSNLGFKASEITDEIAAKTGLHKGPGIVVFEVTPGSIADRSGLKVLDRIMGVAGCGPSMDSLAAMKKCVVKHKAYIGMVVDRGGNLNTVGMRLDAEGR